MPAFIGTVRRHLINRRTCCCEKTRNRPRPVCLHTGGRSWCQHPSGSNSSIQPTKLARDSNFQLFCPTCGTTIWLLLCRNYSVVDNMNLINATGNKIINQLEKLGLNNAQNFNLGLSEAE